MLNTCKHKEGKKLEGWWRETSNADIKLRRKGEGKRNVQFVGFFDNSQNLFLWLFCRYQVIGKAELKAL